MLGWYASNNIKTVAIPGGCTPHVQPLDATVIGSHMHKIELRRDRQQKLRLPDSNEQIP